MNQESCNRSLSKIPDRKGTDVTKIINKSRNFETLHILTVERVYTEMVRKLKNKNKQPEGGA
jgi:hypothetical protein